LHNPAGVVRQDHAEQVFDAVFWCTGFQPKLSHMAELEILEDDGKVMNQDEQSIKDRRLWLFEYGDWVSLGSATLIGAGRGARDNITKMVDI